MLDARRSTLYASTVPRFPFLFSLPFLPLLFLLAPPPGHAQDWVPLPVPGAWESAMGDLDGFGWYRCFVDVPADWEGSRLLLTVRRIDDVDEAYFNGSRVGANGGMPPLFGKPSSDVRRPAVIDPDQVRFGQKNLIAFRVYDEKGRGGIIEGPIQLGRLKDAIDLAGTWDFVSGDQREYAHWPNQNPDSNASRRLLAEYAARHDEQPAGHRGVVLADVEGRERDMAVVRRRFEGNTNVHSNVEGKGTALPPAEALAALDPSPDFIIETVLHEPTVTQPLYVEFDARGRLWVTQYIQYPKPAGLEVLTWDNHLRSVFDVVPPPPPYDKPEERKFIGRDRITIHEDTDGDGTYDKHKVFLEGLNIVTSTCQGDGGVWVMNPPYLLFYPDADGDDIPDSDPVVHLSGFGLEDTHSVANSLKWGPDGWLYACTGSTVTARVRVLSKPEAPPITFFGQNIWRYHPVTHAFELFAEGGWNTFGVDFDAAGRLYSGTNGSMQAVYFVQGGFYQKGFGKHGPHTNPHAFDYFHGIPITGKHQRLVQQWVPYHGGAFPGSEGHFFGVNCLANRVPVIALQPDGSTFKSEELPAAIETEDVWFRPVHAALGPDGNLYISDFYDARITHVDPRDNWDRTHGRIYRLRHRHGTPHSPLDLTSLPTPELIDLLDHPNQWHRWTARRLLGARRDPLAGPLLAAKLSQPNQGALESLWTLHLLGSLEGDAALLSTALRHPNLHVRLWTVRLLGDRNKALSPAVFKAVQALADDPQPEMISQLAASLQRLPTSQTLDLLSRILETNRFTNDPYIPSQLWWALEEHLTRDTDAVVAWLQEHPDLWRTPVMETKLTFLIGRRLAADPSLANLTHAARLLEKLPVADYAVTMIRGMEAGLKGITLNETPPLLGQALANIASTGPPKIELLTFALRLQSPTARTTALELASSAEALPAADRQILLQTLSETPTTEVTHLLTKLAETESDPKIRRTALHGLRRAKNPGLGTRILRLAQSVQDESVRTTAITVLAGRLDWSLELLEAVADRSLTAEAVTLDQRLVMQGHGNAAINRRIEEHWPTPAQPTAAKEKRIREIMAVVAAGSGDPSAGSEVYTQVCAACHQLFGRGGNIGPDLTGYERNQLEFLVTAIVDPNLGVREEFELTTVTLRPQGDSQATAVISGFVEELTDTQLKLRELIGDATVIALRDVLKKENSPVSIMPDALLDALTEKQIRDLFAYLQAPEDPLPGKTTGLE